MDPRSTMKTVVCSRALAVDEGAVSGCMQRVKGSVRKIPRLPSVIRTRRSYEAFRVLTSIDCDVLILVEDGFSDNGYVLVDVDLELGYEYFTYNEVLGRVLPREVQAPSSFEIVGSIVHLNLDESQLKHKDTIGGVIHDKTGKTVITKIGSISNEYRSFDLEVLGGPPVLETVHKEGDMLFFIDYRNVYWCSKLQSERMALVAKLRAGEALCDLFCGVGPVSLPALKKGCRVYANDLNPRAIECLERSITINRLSPQDIETFNLPAQEFLGRISGTRIDHFFLNLPEHSLDYLQDIARWPGDALVHCYFFCRSADEVSQYVLSRTGLAVGPEVLRVVRKVSPSKDMYKLEARCSFLRAGGGKGADGQCSQG